MHETILLCLFDYIFYNQHHKEQIEVPRSSTKDSILRMKMAVLKRRATLLCLVPAPSLLLKGRSYYLKEFYFSPRGANERNKQTIKWILLAS